jgi:hypothetical protein
MLALALDTAPIALMYPGPYLDKMIRLSPKWPELPEVVAVEWFTGNNVDVTPVPMAGDDDNRLIQLSLVSSMNYEERTRPLQVARRVRDLDTRRKDVLREIALKRGKVSDEEIAGLMAVADDLKRQMDAAQAPRPSFFDEHPELMPEGWSSGG